MSQTQKTVALLVLLIALAGTIGGYAYFGVLKGDQALAQKTDHDLRLFAPQKLGERAPDGGSAPADFTTLSVTFQGNTTVVVRSADKGWSVVSPVKAKADKLVVDAILSQLQSSKFKATLDENPDAATLEKYGLAKPTFVVEATAQVNGEPRSVKIKGGIENTFDGSVFIQRNDEKTVYTAEGGVRFSMAKDTFGLRDKQLFALEESKIGKIAVVSINNTYSLEHQKDGQWLLMKPQTQAADAAAISALISSAASERAQAFLSDTQANRNALGIDKPLVDTTITLNDGSDVRFRVARVSGDGGELYYALREDQAGSVLAQVSQGAAAYDRNPNDLKDKAIVRFRRETVTKMLFRNSDGTEVVVAKDSVDASADTWRVVSPRAGKAKVFKVTGALWALSGAKALSAGEEKPKDWGKYGLDRTAKFIALFGQNGEELTRFVIGKEVPGTPGAFYVRGTRDQVLQSDGSRFSELPFALSELLDEPSDGGFATSP